MSKKGQERLDGTWWQRLRVGSPLYANLKSSWCQWCRLDNSCNSL